MWAALLQDTVLKFVTVTTLKAFHCANGCVSIDPYDSVGAIVASFFRVSCPIGCCSIYPRAACQFLVFKGPSEGTPKFQRRSCTGISPPKTEHQNSDKDLRTSQTWLLLPFSRRLLRSFSTPFTCCAVPYWYHLICHGIYQYMFRYNVIGQDQFQICYSDSNKKDLSRII